MNSSALKNALLELEKLDARISIIKHHSRSEFKEFLYDVSIKNTSSIEFFDIGRPNYGIPFTLKIDDISLSKHAKLISDAQWLYNNQTFYNHLKLVFMNSGGLAGLHQQTTQFIQGMINMIEEDIDK